MVWNEAAFQLLGIPTGRADTVGTPVDTGYWPERRYPAAVAEWFRVGADRQLKQLADNQIADPASPDAAQFLDAGLLLLETDSQHCCRWVTPLDGGDNPVVCLIDPDDHVGQSRSPYADSFTVYTEATVWDALLYRSEDAAWTFDHELSQDVLAQLATVLRRRPTTFGWAHNQGCDAIHRFDGAARVAIALTSTTAVWTITSAPEPVMRETIAEILGAG